MEETGPWSDRRAHVQTLRAREDWEGARAVLEAFVDEAPDNPWARTELGRAYLKEKWYDDAIVAFEAAVELAPYDPWPRNLLAAAEDRRDDPYGFYTALEAYPADARGHFRTGRWLARDGKHAEAAEEYLAALRIADLAQVRYFLARALEEVGRPDQAILHLEQAVRLQPNYAAAYFVMGILLEHQQQQIPKAIEAYQAAIRADPENVKQRNNLGVALGKLGRHQEAADVFRMALRAHPRYAWGHYNLATALYETRDYAGAWAHLHRAQELGGVQVDRQFVRRLRSAMPEPLG